jgi:hypothetical protein
MSVAAGYWQVNQRVRLAEIFSALCNKVLYKNCVCNGRTVRLFVRVGQKFIRKQRETLEMQVAVPVELGCVMVSVCLLMTPY